ncbi:MAG: hypothetical protein K8S54_02705 [Spirochaetia bacterium]|nr:hypothetical protein [Spirochaetia bacterium]
MRIALIFACAAAFSLGACKEKHHFSYVEEVTTETILQGNRKGYGPQNLKDGGTEAWCEGRSDNGVGEKITLKLSEPVQVNSLEIANGIQEEKYFSRNNRVKELSVKGYRNDKELFSDLLTLADKPDLILVPIFHFPYSPKVDRVILEIVSIYPGTIGNDTCLTELTWSEQLTPQLSSPQEKGSCRWDADPTRCEDDISYTDCLARGGGLESRSCTSRSHVSLAIPCMTHGELRYVDHTSKCKGSIPGGSCVRDNYALGPAGFTLTEPAICFEDQFPCRRWGDKTHFGESFRNKTCGARGYKIACTQYPIGRFFVQTAKDCAALSNRFAPGSLTTFFDYCLNRPVTADLAVEGVGEVAARADCSARGYPYTCRLEPVHDKDGLITTIRTRDAAQCASLRAQWGMMQ